MNAEPVVDPEPVEDAEPVVDPEVDEGRASVVDPEADQGRASVLRRAAALGRHRGSLRGRLTTALVGTGVVSVVLLATVAFVVIQNLLQFRAEGQLASIRDDRAAAVERVLDGLASTTSAIAADPGLVDAFGAFATAWPELGPDLDGAEQTELEATLDADVATLPDALDVPRPDPVAMVAGSPQGRRAQDLYIVDNPEPPDQRDLLDDAGDGSDFSAAHADNHPYLRALLDDTVGSDLMFVSADTGEVIYSVAKHADFGTNLVDGPWQDTGLGVVVDRLLQVSAGQTAVVDSGFHLPAGTAPTMFLASTVRDGSQVLGALVVEVEISTLTDFVTADSAWDRLGLGETGQVYVVGGDRTLRTEPRGWREDPDAWLERVADSAPEGGETAALVAETGTPVQVQSVTTEAVEAAAEGDDVVLSGADLVGVPSLSAASPVEAAGLDWVLVAEQARSETSASIGRFLAILGLLLLVLVPLIAVVGWLVARSLTRPHEPVIEASAALAAGRLDVDLPDLGTNELGDLARQLDRVAAEIRTRRRVIDDEDRRIEELLSAVVPRRLMERVRAGERGYADVLETATVVVVTLVGLPDSAGADDDLLVAFTGRATGEIERLAADQGLEPATVASNQERFLAGHGRPGTDAEAAARFATAVSEVVRATADEFGLDVDARVGMAAGQVGTGLVGSSQLSFAVWGDPPDVAATLDGLARPGEVLVDATLADELGDGWSLEPLEDAVGLDDEPLEAWLLRGRDEPVGPPATEDPLDA